MRSLSVMASRGSFWRAARAGADRGGEFRTEADEATRSGTGAEAVAWPDQARPRLGPRSGRAGRPRCAAAGRAATASGNGGTDHDQPETGPPTNTCSPSDRALLLARRPSWRTNVLLTRSQVQVVASGARTMTALLEIDSITPRSKARTRGPCVV